MSRINPDRPVCAVGVVVWKDGCVLLVRRANPPNQGTWSLPGGAQELGETVAQAARREVAEETGVEIEVLGLIDVVDAITPDNEKGGEGIRYHYTLIDMGARWLSGELAAGDDALEAGWFALCDLGQLSLWAETERIIERSAALHGPKRTAGKSA